MRLLMAGCSCTGVSAIPRSVATPRIPSPKTDVVPEESTRMRRSLAKLLGVADMKNGFLTFAGGHADNFEALVTDFECDQELLVGHSVLSGP